MQPEPIVGQLDRSAELKYGGLALLHKCLLGYLDLDLDFGFSDFDSFNSD